MRPARLLAALTGAVLTGSAVRAQQPTATGTCATPDSVAFRGLSRIPEGDVRADVDIAPKSTINSRIVTRALRNLYATNNFEANGTAACETIDGKTVLVFTLTERRVLSDVSVTGPKQVSASSVRDRVDVLIGKPINPAQVAKDVARIDSLYQAEGYFLAKVTVDTIKEGAATTLVFRIDEGRRLAISGVQVEGNKALSAKEIVGAMSTSPEGFFWWKKGEFDQDKFNEDISKSIPQLYAAHGYIDAQVVKDTLIVDR